jgi:hypothetical protein
MIRMWRVRQAEAVLLAAGLAPSPHLHRRTVREVVGEVIHRLGVPAELHFLSPAERDAGAAPAAPARGRSRQHAWEAGMGRLVGAVRRELMAVLERDLRREAAAAAAAAAETAARQAEKEGLGLGHGREALGGDGPVAAAGGGDGEEPVTPGAPGFRKDPAAAAALDAERRRAEAAEQAAASAAAAAAAQAAEMAQLRAEAATAAAAAAEATRALEMERLRAAAAAAELTAAAQAAEIERLRAAAAAVAQQQQRRPAESGCCRVS